MGELVDGGGCDAMLRIFRKHGASDSEIIRYGCLILCLLTGNCAGMRPSVYTTCKEVDDGDNDDLKLPTTTTQRPIDAAARTTSNDIVDCACRVIDHLGAIGFCRALISCISLHVGDVVISELGLAAIASLGAHSNSNKFLLSKANCCDVITQVGSFGFNMRHERSSTIATHFCAAVEVLCEASNVSKLVDSGCSQMLVALIKLHQNDVYFSAAAVKAVCGLSSLSADLRADLMRFGVCELLTVMYSQHSMTCQMIIIDICEATLHLSSDLGNIERIGAAGLCEVLVEALRTHLLWVEQGAEVATTAMLHLVGSSYRTCNHQDHNHHNYGADNQYRFVDARIIEALQMTLYSELLSFRTLDNLTKLFEVFAVEDIRLSSHSLTQRIVRLDNQQYCSVFEYLTLKKEPVRATIHIVSYSSSSDGNDDHETAS